MTSLNIKGSGALQEALDSSGLSSGNGLSYSPDAVKGIVQRAVAQWDNGEPTALRDLICGSALDPQNIRPDENYP